MKIQRSFVCRAAAAAIAAFGTTAGAPALAAQQAYTFTQAGFNGGGVLQGRFVVDDLNHDGAITSVAGELLSFAMSFDGDTLVPSFSMGLQELGALNWRLGSLLLGDEILRRGAEGLISDYTLEMPFNYATGLGPTSVPGGYVIDMRHAAVSSTSQPVSVSAVPEPSSYALMGAGLALLAGLARRRSAR